MRVIKGGAPCAPLTPATRVYRLTDAEVEVMRLLVRLDVADPCQPATGSSYLTARATLLAKIEDTF